MARIYLFLTKIGIDPKRLRFRQHMANEMAHYASDCWDAEIHSSYGWIECVGCADRSAYDLTVHSVKTGRQLVVREQLDEPKIEERWVASIDRKKFGPLFKGEAKAIENLILALDQERLQCVSTELQQKGCVCCLVSAKHPNIILKLDKHSSTGRQRCRCARRCPKGCSTDNQRDWSVPSHVCKFQAYLHPVREFTPNVIEPSFGIGRILYSLLEHSYWAREEDAARGVSSDETS